MLAILIAFTAFVQSALSQSSCVNGGSYWDGSSGTCKYCICGDGTTSSTTCYSEYELKSMQSSSAYATFQNTCPDVQSCPNQYWWGTAQQCSCPKCFNTYTSTTSQSTTQYSTSSSGSGSTTTGSGSVSSTTNGVTQTQYSTTSGNSASTTTSTSSSPYTSTTSSGGSTTSGNSASTTTSTVTQTYPYSTSTTTYGNGNTNTMYSSSNTFTTTKQDVPTTTTGNGNTNTNTMYSSSNAYTTTRQDSTYPGSSSTFSTTWNCANTYDFKYMDGMCTWCSCTTTSANTYAYECHSQEQLTDTDVSRIKMRCQLTCDSAYWKWSTDATHCCPYCEQSTSTTTTREPYTTSTCPYNDGYQWSYDATTGTCKFNYCDSPGACSVCDGTTTSSSNYYYYDRFWIAKYCGLEHCGTWQYPSPTTSNDGTTTPYCQCPTCEDETPYTTKPGYNCYDEWTLQYVSSTTSDGTNSNTYNYCAYCYCYDASASVNQCWPYSTSSTDYMYKACPDARNCAYEKLIWDNDCTCPSCPSDATTTKVDSSNTGTSSGDSTTSGSTSVNCANTDDIRCDTYDTETGNEPVNQPRLIFTVWVNTENVWNSRSQVWLTLKRALDEFLTKYGLSLSDVLQYFYIRDWGVKCWYNNVYYINVDPNNHCSDDIKSVDETTFTGSASGNTGARRLQENTNTPSNTDASSSSSSSTSAPSSTSSISNSLAKRCTFYISIGVYPGSESAVESIVQIIKNHFSDIPFDYKNYAVDVAVSYDTYGFIRAAIQEAEYTQYDANGNVVSTGRTGSDSSKLMINFICLIIVLIITMAIML